MSYTFSELIFINCWEVTLFLLNSQNNHDATRVEKGDRVFCNICPQISKLHSTQTQKLSFLYLKYVPSIKVQTCAASNFY